MFGWFRHRASTQTPAAAPEKPENLTLTKARALYPHLFAATPTQPAAAVASEVSGLDGDSELKTATPTPPEIQPQETPAIAEEINTMATAPVTLEPASTSAEPAATPDADTATKETVEQKVEAAFTKVGHFFEDITNIAVNTAEETEPQVLPLLPSAFQPEYTALLNFAATGVASIDAKYAAIGKSNVPFAVKVVEAVATFGQGALAIAAQAGVTVGNLNTLFASAATIAQNLNVTTLTAAPTATPTAS